VKKLQKPINEVQKKTKQNRKKVYFMPKSIERLCTQQIRKSK